MDERATTLYPFSTLIADTRCTLQDETITGGMITYNSTGSVRTIPSQEVGGGVLEATDGLSSASLSDAHAAHGAVAMLLEPAIDAPAEHRRRAR